MLLRGIIAIALLGSTGVFADTLFQRLESSFEKARLPAHKELKGYWAGRCVEESSQDKFLPAVFIDKVVSDPASFPPSHPAFTYYRDELAKPEAYDNFSVSQLEKEPAIASWLKKEQWQPVAAVEGSLVSMFDMAGGVKIERAVRYFEDEFNSLIVLRATRINQAVSSVTRYCFFNKALGGGAPVDPIDPGGDYLIGDIFSAPPGLMQVNNLQPDRLFKKLRFENLGSAARLQNLQLQLGNGNFTGPITLELPAQGSVSLVVQGLETFSLLSLRMYFEVPAGEIRIVGVE